MAYLNFLTRFVIIQHSDFLLIRRIVKIADFIFWFTGSSSPNGNYCYQASKIRIAIVESGQFIEFLQNHISDHLTQLNQTLQPFTFTVSSWCTRSTLQSKFFATLLIRQFFSASLNYSHSHPKLTHTFSTTKRGVR